MYQEMSFKTHKRLHDEYEINASQTKPTKCNTKTNFTLHKFHYFPTTKCLINYYI